MTRMVECKKYGEALPGLERAPFPGADGQAIFEAVSAKAWQEWLEYQTRLINEKQLQLFDASAQQYLAEQRVKFLSNQAVDEVEGYVPPAS